MIYWGRLESKGYLEVQGQRSYPKLQLLVQVCTLDVQMRMFERRVYEGSHSAGN